MNPNNDATGAPSRQDMHIKEIRELAKRFSPEELERCMNQQLNEGCNSCDTEASAEETMNVLAKADYVRHLIDGGMSLGEAIRELGRRIRALRDGGG